MRRIQAKLRANREEVLQQRQLLAQYGASHDTDASSAFAMRDMEDALPRVSRAVAAPNLTRKSAVDLYEAIRQTHEEQRTLQAFVANLQSVSSSTEEHHTDQKMQRLLRFAHQKLRRLYTASSEAFFRVGLDVQRFPQEHLKLQQENATYRQKIQELEENKENLYTEIMQNLEADMTRSGTDTLWVQLRPGPSLPAIDVPLSCLHQTVIHREPVDRLARRLRDRFLSYGLPVNHDDPDVLYNILTAELGYETDEMIRTSFDTDDRLILLLASASKRFRDETQAALQRSTNECLERMRALTEINQTSIAVDIAELSDKNMTILILICRMMMFGMFKAGILVVPLHRTLIAHTFNPFPFARDFCIKISALCSLEDTPVSNGLLRSMGYVCKLVIDICFNLCLEHEFRLDGRIHYPVEQKVACFMDLVRRFVEQREGETAVTLMDLHRFFSEDLQCPILYEPLDHNSVVILSASGAQDHLFSCSSIHDLFNSNRLFDEAYKTVDHPLTREGINMRNLRKPSFLLTLILKYNEKMFRTPRERAGVNSRFAAVPVYGHETHSTVNALRRNLGLAAHPAELS